MIKCMLFLLLASSTSFAGSFVKEDLGSLEWNLNIKKKAGTVSISKSLSGLRYRHEALSETEEKSLAIYTFNHASIGKFSNGVVNLVAQSFEKVTGKSPMQWDKNL